jgi:hypothetical protein
MGVNRLKSGSFRTILMACLRSEYCSPVCCLNIWVSRFFGLRIDSGFRPCFTRTGWAGVESTAETARPSAISQASSSSRMQTKPIFAGSRTQGSRNDNFRGVFGREVHRPGPGCMQSPAETTPFSHSGACEKARCASDDRGSRLLENTFLACAAGFYEPRNRLAARNYFLNPPLSAVGHR